MWLQLPVGLDCQIKVGQFNLCEISECKPCGTYRYLYWLNTIDSLCVCGAHTEVNSIILSLTRDLYVAVSLNRYKSRKIKILHSRGHAIKALKQAAHKLSACNLHNAYFI